MFYLKKCVVTTLEEVHENYNIFYLSISNISLSPTRNADDAPEHIVPYDILEATTKFMTDPICIIVKRDELTLEGNQGIMQPSPEYTL